MHNSMLSAMPVSLDWTISWTSADLPEYVILQTRNFSGASRRDFKTLSPVENVQALDLPEQIEMDLIRVSNS